MKYQTKKCIFCGFPKVTKEHFFSRWTHKYLAIPPKGRTEIIRGTRYLDRDDFQIFKLPGAMRDWQIRCVCSANCNNGWMRKHVEEKANPILTKLIQGDPVRITPSEQQCIATWAALKCMVSEYGEGSYVITHHTQRRRMMLRRLPPEKGWGIWIGSCNPNTSNLSWTFNPYSIASAEKVALNPDKSPTHYNSYSAAIIIKKLFVQVLRQPDSSVIKQWEFHLPDGGKLFRIWPPSSFGISWPSKTLSTREVNLVRSEMERTIMRAVRKRGSGKTVV